MLYTTICANLETSSHTSATLYCRLHECIVKSIKYTTYFSNHSKPFTSTLSLQHSHKIIRSARGTRIEIPAFNIKQSVAKEVSAAGGGKYAVDDSTFALLWLRSNIAVDENEWEDICHPFGVYRITMAGFVLYQVAFVVYAGIHMNNVMYLYRVGNKGKKSQNAYVLRMLIFVPEILAALVGIVALIDPFGHFLMIDFITARTMIVYSIDMINAFVASRTNDQVVPVLIQYPWGLPLITSVGILVPITDLLLTIASETGNLNFPIATKIPVIFLALVYLIGTSILLYLSYNVGEAVDAAEEKAAVDSVKRTATSADRQIAAMIAKIKTLRKYMLFSALGRIACIAGIMVAGFNFILASPHIFVFTVVMLFASANITSSTFQVLIAVEITPAKKKSKKPSTGNYRDS